MNEKASYFYHLGHSVMQLCSCHTGVLAAFPQNKKSIKLELYFVVELIIAESDIVHVSIYTE